MKFHHLHAVTAVADRGSLRAAARALGMSQPALTHSIGELERELGASLFERRARGMALTPVGELFVQRARVITSESRRAQEEVAQFLGASAGDIVVCLSVVAHLALLPMALPLFQQRYPQARLRILEGAFPAMASRVRDGSIDFYIGPTPEPALAREFVVEQLFDNTRAIFARKGHPLANARSLKDLMGAQWMTTGITERAEAEFEEFFASHGLPVPQIAVQGESMLSMLMTLMSTDMLTITLRQFDEFPLTRSALQIIDTRETMSAPPIAIVRRAALPLTPAADYLCDMFRRAAVAYAGAMPKAPAAKAAKPRARRAATPTPGQALSARRSHR
ncbi:MAG TPA: LysR substrate-binding domain-containing protein [Burkholderiales bacterium]